MEKKISEIKSFINPYVISLQGFPVSREVWKEEEKRHFEG